MFFTGSSAARNRLYRIAISNNFEQLALNFHIFGIVEDKTLGKNIAVKFNSKINFIGFLIKRKGNGK